MTSRTRTAIALLLVAASLGCGAAVRHRVLTVFFDGVPPLGEAPPVTAAGAASPAAKQRQVLYGTHGPYAAKMCGACHRSASDNALVAPKDQLCQRCHEIRMDRRYVHGPLASGGCLVCHDPHGSRHRYLLVDEPARFCAKCHDATSVARVPAHAGHPEACTTCHDAHMSDRRFLLREAVAR